jgi:hypothetical protein
MLGASRIHEMLAGMPTDGRWTLNRPRLRFHRDCKTCIATIPALPVGGELRGYRHRFDDHALMRAGMP